MHRDRSKTAPPEQGSPACIFKKIVVTYAIGQANRIKFMVTVFPSILSNRKSREEQSKHESLLH